LWHCHHRWPGLYLGPFGINDALAVLQEQGYGREPADAWYRDLKKVREAVIAKYWSRTYINSQVNRIKRLRKGMPGVHKTEKACPVPRHHIKPVISPGTNSPQGSPGSV
jgi:hypothetical protein